MRTELGTEKFISNFQRSTYRLSQRKWTSTEYFRSCVSECA